ncbi:hypothetical protein [Anabaena sp. UHCC 0204]|uniref:hypothetical protein n=1 Tax=Anabaena sp. UHCC 0204 TaxID=2590009 RepID=UPI001445DD2B|nr:hypothetical protein [Anabaena sp. UHCC 0204]MTJ06998.1 hypothetical protein [Anabaena sp. UHCC 0204]
MVVNNFHSITEVLPAIIGFSIAGILILKFVFSVKIPQYNENPPGVLISSFIFIVSGFLFEIIYIYWSSIQSWAEGNSKIAFIFTILGGFCTNRFLKKIADDKEKREISVLFRNSIDLQVKSLQVINLYLSFASTEENINCMKIYKNNLLVSKAYDTALNKIGIYDEKDIDIISKYSNELQQCFNYIERFLIEFKLDEDIKVKETHFDSIEYQPQYERTLIIVKIAILTTSLFGIFTSYYLSKHYLNNNLGKLQDEFFNEYEEILDKFKEKLSFISELYIMNEVISSDLFDKLKYIRNNFIESINSYNVSSRKPIYLYRIFIRKTVFHRDNIVTFGESPEDAKNNCDSIIEYLKNTLKLEIEIQDSSPICEIISPWK